MVTDPARKRRSDPGNPDICPVFDLHKIFTPAADRESWRDGLPHGGDRLPGLQGRPAQAHAAAAAGDPRAPSGVRGEAGHHQAGALEGSRRARAVAQRDDGRGARRREADAMTARTPTSETATEACQAAAARRRFRGPARPAAAPVPYQGDRSRRAAGAYHHRSVPGHLEAIEFQRSGDGRRLSRDGRHAHLPQVEAAGAARSRERDEELDEEALALKASWKSGCASTRA